MSRRADSPAPWWAIRPVIRALVIRRRKLSMPRRYPAIAGTSTGRSGPAPASSTRQFVHIKLLVTLLRRHRRGARRRMQSGIRWRGRDPDTVATGRSGIPTPRSGDDGTTHKLGDATGRNSAYGGLAHRQQRSGPARGQRAQEWRPGGSGPIDLWGAGGCCRCLPGASGPGTASRSGLDPASTLLGSNRTASSRRPGDSDERSGYCSCGRGRASCLALDAAFRKMRRAGTL